MPAHWWCQSRRGLCCCRLARLCSAPNSINRRRRKLNNGPLGSRPEPCPFSLYQDLTRTVVRRFRFFEICTWLRRWIGVNQFVIKAAIVLPIAGHEVQKVVSVCGLRTLKSRIGRQVCHHPSASSARGVIGRRFRQTVHLDAEPGILRNEALIGGVDFVAKDKVDEVNR